MNVCCNIYIPTCQGYELIFPWHIFQFRDHEIKVEWVVPMMAKMARDLQNCQIGNRFFAIFGVPEGKTKSAVKT